MQIAIKDLNTANAVAAEQREQAVQSNLARLLATENIHVAFRKAKTAYFNVKTRVLVIPIYAADLPREVVQMLVGHEVGHALYTPEEGWHDTVCKRGMLYKSYMNVVEDARIERKVKDKYPGLRRDFHFGYSHLINAGFFGPVRQVKDPRWVAGLSLVDKINLYFKAGPHIPSIRFTTQELELVETVQSAETFDDVLAVTDAIWLYDKQYRARQRAEQAAAAKKAAEEAIKRYDQNRAEEDHEEDDDEGRHEDDGIDSQDPQPQMPPRSEDNEDDLSDMDDNEDHEPVNVDDEERDSGEVTGDDVAGGTADDAAGEETDEESDDEEGESSGPGSGGAGGDVDVDMDAEPEPEGSYTDRAFRDLEGSLIDPSSRDIVYAKVMTPPDEKEVKLPYKNLLAVMDQHLATEVNCQIGRRDKEFKAAWLAAEEVKFLQDFRKKHERFVVHLAREFEMKRNAWTAARARESRTGTLNLTKMYQYKYNDDLFKKVMQVPNGKNHGMIMVVDMSGSMSRVLESVLEQAAVLAMFCRRVQIPFRVYGFTNPVLSDIEREFGHQFPKAEHLMMREHRYQMMYGEAQEEASVRCEQYVLVELLSDRMSLRDFNHALFCYFSKLGRSARNATLPMHATPLNDAILTIPSLVKNMRADYRVEKVSVIVLTDGCSDSSNMVGKRPNNPSTQRLFLTSPWTKKVFEVKPVMRTRMWGGKPVATFDDLGNTKAYIQMAEDACGASIIGYHVVSGKNAAKMLVSYEGYYTQDREAMKMQFRNNKMMSIDDFGYKQYFIMWDKALSEEDKTMDSAKPDMTARKLATMFTEVQKSQQVNRVFLSKFVDMIA